MKCKVSLIIPVHDGEKWIGRTVKGIMAQDYNNLEVILVENASKDNSWETCCKLADKNERVFAIRTQQKGTSIARKIGIEAATGDYIVFSDQDDRYRNNSAITEMVNAIQSNKADICQFAYFKAWHGMIKNLKRLPLEYGEWNRESFFSQEIGGVMGIPDNCFNTTVWNKIYCTHILKEAVKQIAEPLYYAEDENLNILAFSSPEFTRAVAINKAFYVWNSTSGFSSKRQSEIALLKDYETVKRNAVRVINTFCNNSESLLWGIHSESLYCMRAAAIQIAKEKNMNKKEILKHIECFLNYQFINEAKKFFENYKGPKMVWDELRFLASNYSAEEFYEYCIKEIKNQSGNKSVINRAISTIIK